LEGGCRLLGLLVQYDGYAHIVIDHGVRHPANISEEVAVRFHEGKSILSVKEISIAQSAVWHTEYGHHKGYLLLADKQFYLTPVKLAFLTRFTMDAKIDVFGFRRFFTLFLVDILTDAGVTDIQTFSD